jgi:hypothetical protein
MSYEPSDFLCETCEKRGRHRPAELWIGIPPSAICKPCPYGLPHPNADGMSAALLRLQMRRSRMPSQPPVLAPKPERKSAPQQRKRVRGITKGLWCSPW